MKKKLALLGLLGLVALAISHGLAAPNTGGTKSMKINSQWKCYSTGDACIGPV